MLKREGWVLMNTNDNLERMQRERKNHEDFGETMDIQYDPTLKTWVMWMKAKDLFECEECNHVWESHELSNCPECNSKYTSTVEDD